MTGKFIWRDVEVSKPPCNMMILVHSEKWIDEDVCPDGVTIGFFQNNYDDFVSAKWNMTNDCFDDIDCHTPNYMPQKWMFLPDKPNTERNEI